MKSFKSLDRDWQLTVNYSAGERVKALTNLDLFSINIFEEIGNNPMKLIETLYAICQPEADANKITKQQFVDSLAGDTIEKAADALTQEIIDFFPSSRRETLKRLLATAEQLQGKALEMLDAKLKDPNLLNELGKQLNGPSGVAPASAESTPAPSPSVS